MARPLLLHAIAGGKSPAGQSDLLKSGYHRACGAYDLDILLKLREIQN